MTEITSSIKSQNGDIQKDYEAVEMLKTEIDDDVEEKERIVNADSEKQVTVRRVI